MQKCRLLQWVDLKLYDPELDKQPVERPEKRNTGGTKRFISHDMSEAILDLLNM